MRDVVRVRSLRVQQSAYVKSRQGCRSFQVQQAYQPAGEGVGMGYHQAGSHVEVDGPVRAYDGCEGPWHLRSNRRLYLGLIRDLCSQIGTEN